MNSHPYADLFPLLDGDDLDRLAEDIREHGSHQILYLTSHYGQDGPNTPTSLAYRGCDWS